MVLLNNVVHVLTRPTLAFFRKQLFALEVTDGADVGGILIDIDHSWGGDVRPAQHFSEETLGCSSATAAAINIRRIAAWLMGDRPEGTRISPFAMLVALL